MQKNYKQLVRLLVLALIVVGCLPASVEAARKQPAPPPGPVKITVLATAGLSGHIINWDYDKSQTVDFGLVKLSSLIKKERQSNSYSLLIDGGNMLSGTPLTDYFAIERSTFANPMVTTYNVLGYDAAVLGEGEFAYGSDYLSTALSFANFPVLSANVHSSGKLANTIKPYTIKEFDVGKERKKERIRIGIIGVTTATAESMQHGVTFKDQASSLQAIAKKLNNKVDAIIIARNDGLDINGLPLAVPGKFGSSLSRTELTFVKVGKRWQLVQNETSSLSTVVAPVDKALADLAWPYHDATLQHLNKGQSDKENPDLEQIPQDTDSNP